MRLFAPDPRVVASAQLAPHRSCMWHMTHLGPCGPVYGHPYVPEAGPRELLSPHPRQVLPAACAWTGPGPRVHPTLPGPVHRWPHLPVASAPGTPAVPGPSPGGRAGSLHLGVQVWVRSRGPSPEHLSSDLGFERPSTRPRASRIRVLRPEPTCCPAVSEAASPQACPGAPQPSPLCSCPTTRTPALQPAGPTSQPPRGSSRQARHILPRDRGASPLVPAKPAPTAPAGPLCLRSSSPGWECPWLTCSPVPPSRLGVPPTPG